MMARRRRMLISVSILALVALGIFVGGWLLQPKPRIDRAAADQIKPGMTLREVEEIIGVPPGDYGVGKGETQPTWESLQWPFKRPPHTTQEWLGQENAISVWIDDDGKVTGHSFQPVYREYDSTFDRLLGMIGLKQKKQRMPDVLIL